jgi:hypothetical protein
MIMAWVLTILAWLVFLVSEWAGLSSVKWPIVTSPIFEKVALGVAIILTLRVIFWLPFRRHEKLAAELDAIKPQPPKIKAPVPEPAKGNKFERLNGVANESKDTPPVADLGAINQPQPPPIKAAVPEQTNDKKFERVSEVATESRSKTPDVNLDAANQPEPPKIKSPAAEQKKGRIFERLSEAANESRAKTPAVYLDATNQPAPPTIKAPAPEQTKGRKFQRLSVVENESQGRTPDVNLDAINQPQPPKIKAPAPEPARGNMFERLVEIKNESEGRTPDAELEAINKPQPLIIKALPPEQTIENKFECLIEVENESESKTAENVEVKLWKIDPIPKYASSTIDLPLHFPILPQAKSKNPDVLAPKNSTRFVLFNATQTLSEVTFEIVGVEHNLKTFSHVYWEWPPHYPFPKGKPPEVLEYRITISVSSNRHALVKETFKLECPSRWIHEKPFTLIKI